MGGGDLNLKKSWHPLTYRNLEKVWKREKRAEEERQKTEQLRKELEEERAMQELKALQQATGRVKKDDRLEWMYNAGPGGGMSTSTEEKEAFLLGKKRVDKLIEQGKTAEELSAREQFSASNAAVYGQTANTWRDTQAKIREDPLLAIKRREQVSLQAVLSNPLQVKRIKEQIQQQKSKKSKKSKEKKKKSKHKRSKSPSPEPSSDSSSFSDSDEPKRKHLRDPSPIGKRSQEKSRVNDEVDAFYGKKISKNSKSRSRSPSNRSPKIYGNSLLEEIRSDRNLSKKETLYEKEKQQTKEKSSRDRCRSSSRSSSRGPYDGKTKERKHGHYHHRENRRRDSRQTSRSRDEGRRGYSRFGSRYSSSKDEENERSSHSHQNYRCDYDGEKRGSNFKNGYNRNSSSRHVYDRDDHLRSSTLNIKSEDNGASIVRGEIKDDEKRRQEEERERKLKAMMTNAHDLEQERLRRIEVAKTNEKKEEKTDLESRIQMLNSKEGGSMGDKFLRDLHRKMMTSGENTAADMISRNRAYTQKGGEFVSRG